MSQDQQNNGQQRPPGAGLLPLLIILLPLVLVLVALLGGWPIPWPLVFVILLFSWVLLFLLQGARRRDRGPGAEQPSAEDEQDQRDRARHRARRIAESLPGGLFQLRGWSIEAIGLVIRGVLRGDPEQTIATVEEVVGEEVGPEAVVSLTQSGDGTDTILITSPELGHRLRGIAPRRRPWLALGLFLATIVTTIIAGAGHQGVNVYTDPTRWTAGLPYAIGILLILGIHELGHFFAARHHQVRTSFPYFIPVPFALGTFGAFISMPPLVRDRRQIFDIGVAGPIAGLVVAIPALALGLHWSAVIPPGSEPVPSGLQNLHGGLDVGSSMLMALIAKVSIGERLLQGHVLELHPLAFAGWLGLMITALNLIPVGQLDGGHVSYALFGPRRARQVGQGALISLFLLAIFIYPGLLFWAFIVFFLAGGGRFPARDDLTPLSSGRQVLAWTSYVLLVLILAPLPRAWYGLLGLH